ncbi:hypothetical protein [Caldiplasma sukawensis]
MEEKIKMLFIISSGEEAKEKALAGLTMAVRTAEAGRADVRILFFGPSEEMIAKGDETVNSLLKRATEINIYKTACTFIASNKKIEKELTDKKVLLEPAGQVVAKAISEGYVPLTF